MSKPLKNIFPDDITLEYTVYVALLEKYTFHLLFLLTTPLLGMTEKIAWLSVNLYITEKYNKM